MAIINECPLSLLSYCKALKLDPIESFSTIDMPVHMVILRSSSGCVYV